jgi:hypothetical protein
MEITRLKARISGLAWRITLLLAPALLVANFAAAQDLGSVNPEPLPPLANPNDPATPAEVHESASGAHLGSGVCIAAVEMMLICMGRGERLPPGPRVARQVGTALTKSQSSRSGKNAPGRQADLGARKSALDHAEYRS